MWTPPPSLSSTAPTRDGAHRQRKFKFLVLGAAAAGKTSLLRRYFHHQFDYERRPTLGSDFYVGKVPHHGDDLEITVQVQFWDTPGTLSKIGKKPKGHHYSASLSDSFFQHADAIMLLYDMTSSTSFTRLLKWYSDLIKLFAKTDKRLPILVVANKLDLFQVDKPGARHPPCRVPQREVLGLPKDYSGSEYHYEYSVCPNASSGNNIHVGNGNHMFRTTNQNQNSDVVSGGNSLQPVPATARFGSRRGRSEISSYLVNRENWTTDGSYLESLLHSEDASHPDREMVLLWCLRNDLALYEVSAATGEGVNEAMEALVTLALEASKVEEEETTLTTTTTNSTTTEAGYSTGRQNQELDLHRRYAPKEETCCCCCRPPGLFRNCSRATDLFTYKKY